MTQRFTYGYFPINRTSLVSCDNDVYSGINLYYLPIMLSINVIRKVPS